MPKRMIRASDGSNRERSTGKAKNRRTLAGSAIPDINRPSPNSSPAKYEKIVFDVSDGRRILGTTRWFVMRASNTEAVMKIHSGDDG